MKRVRLTPLKFRRFWQEFRILRVFGWRHKGEQRKNPLLNERVRQMKNSDSFAYSEICGEVAFSGREEGEKFLAFRWLKRFAKMYTRKCRNQIFPRREKIVNKLKERLPSIILCSLVEEIGMIWIHQIKTTNLDIGELLVFLMVCLKAKAAREMSSLQFETGIYGLLYNVVLSLFSLQVPRIWPNYFRSLRTICCLFLVLIPSKSLQQSFASFLGGMEGGLTWWALSDKIQSFPLVWWEILKTHNKL